MNVNKKIKTPRPPCDNTPGVHMGRYSLLLDSQAATHSLALQEVGSWQGNKVYLLPEYSCCLRRVHKEHHESFNPDPFSGLSMHWAESFIYFSASILISPIVPLWVFRLLSLGQLVSTWQSPPSNI